ncbi:MAG: hypothetical protein Q8Q87_03375 [Candidatus Omnitrophota bacterium]|nr:hypothetical protein [Candidatus Omnitrophota bacterium]
MRKIKIILLSVAIVSFLFVNLAFSEEKKPAPAQQVVKEKKEMTKDEILTELKETLKDEEEILDYIPELKKGRGEDGKEFYTYQGARLEDLEKEKLEKILGRVNNQAVMIRTDRINRQLEVIRQTQRIQAAPRIAAPPQVSVPAVPTPRATTYSTPPKISQPPPTPQKR